MCELHRPWTIHNHLKTENICVRIALLQGEKMASIEDFRKLEFRVAEILEAAYHPQADKLYVLDIRVGEEKKRIVAGIRNFYSLEELKGKKVVVVNNLEPAVIRGVESQGMLLAASDSQTLTLVTPERPIDAGATVK